MTFLFDRLGVRVPAILVSPWAGSRVVPGVGEAKGRNIRACFHSRYRDESLHSRIQGTHVAGGKCRDFSSTCSGHDDG